MKRPALQNNQVGVLRMAFRARKVLGTFEKRAPGLSSVFCISRGWCFNKGCIACLRLSPSDWSVQKMLKVKVKVLVEQKYLEIIRNVNLIPFKFHWTKKTVEIKRKLVTCGKISNCLSSQGVITTKLEIDFFFCFFCFTDNNSTITTWGRHGESKAFRNMLEQVSSMLL